MDAVTDVSLDRCFHVIESEIRVSDAKMSVGAECSQGPALAFQAYTSVNPTRTEVPSAVTAASPDFTTHVTLPVKPGEPNFSACDTG